MAHFVLECSECGTTHEPDMATLACRGCGSPLLVSYLEGAEGVGPILPAGWTGPNIPLPLHDRDMLVSLGEGGTPCVELGAIGRLLGLNRLFAKLEIMNPTGSFKDRGTAVMMSAAREHGVTEVVEDSSGNAGASVSAYAARAGIKAHIFAPAGAPEAKLQQIRVYGAEAHLIEGSREATTEAALAYQESHGLVYASHNMSPYFIEGTKTLAYELSTELPELLHIVMPVGNGSLFIGAWQGYRELTGADVVADMPRFHAVQAASVIPIVAAHQGQAWSVENAFATIAGGIAVADPPRLRQALRVLESTQGVAVAVADEATLRWQRLLAETEGIYAEPTSAAAFAGLEELVGRGEIGADESVVVPVTGFGLKDKAPV